MHIGNNIERIIKIKRLKQTVLAKEIGISQQTLSRMLTKPQLSPEILEKFTKAFDMTREQIERFDEERLLTSITDNHGTIISHVQHVHVVNLTINGLDETTAKKLLEYINQLGTIKE